MPVASRFFACLGLATMVGSAAPAADFSDPTWPCIQRKVETLSVGQMFPYVLPDLPEGSEAVRARVDELSAPLALRRFGIEEVEPWIDEFAAEHPSNAALGALYQATFDLIDNQRRKIIAGIARYAEKQSGLSERIDAARAEMEKIMATDDPDFDRVDALEEQLDWDQRIYRDRQRALTYVCESPVLLEKRAYELGRIVQEHWQDG